MTVILRKERAFKNALEFRPLVFIGLISYSIYLWHFFLLEVISFTGLLNTGIPPFIMFMTAILTVVVISTFSYYGIEKSFLKLKAR